MLTVDVKFIADELFPGLVGGEYTVGDGATVLDLLAECERRSGATVPEKNYKYMYPLFNGKPVKLDGAIPKDGVLHLCRVVMGG